MKISQFELKTLNAKSCLEFKSTGIEVWNLFRFQIYYYKAGNKVQKQPSIGFLRKRCSGKMQQIYRRTPRPKCDFNKVALQLYWNHTSAWGHSPVNLLNIFRTPFYKNTSGGLLLKVNASSRVTPFMRLGSINKIYSKF